MSTSSPYEEDERPASTSSAMMIDDEDETEKERVWKTKLHALKAELTEFCRQGNVARALKLAKQVFEMQPSDKTDKKIQKLQALLDDTPEEEEDYMVDIGQGFQLFKDLSQQLYPYQIEGVKWMWWLFNKKKGGILGDDMGDLTVLTLNERSAVVALTVWAASDRLWKFSSFERDRFMDRWKPTKTGRVWLGKTIQVIAYLSGLFDADLIQTVLIVMPVSLLLNWRKEFEKWAPGISVYQYYGTPREREQALAKVRRRGGVLLISYGLLVTNNEELGEQNRRLYTWDYVMLDEGHKIKTSTTKTSKAAHSIPAKHRLVLSGTPLQNNLKEMWALFDFVHHGTLLGTFRTFRCEYDVPITKARAKDATPSEKKLGLEIADSLRTLIQPYFLRRTKAEVLEHPTENKNTTVSNVPNLVRKNELVVWLYLSKAQQKIYYEFLSSDEVKQILMTKQSPLVQLTVLKKLCDHPRLLSRRNCIKLGLEGEQRVNENEDELDEETYQMCIGHLTNEELMRESGKLLFLVELVRELKRTSHRVLIFSQSRKMLDIIERLLSNEFKYLRIDGTVANPQDRQSRITRFQKDSSITVFLLTTQVGGVGLTLTGADRVIIYDPSWNPATDAQAVDRVYRIGQSKPVVVYRLITCGTVEEKIYRRQIFKDSLTRQTTGDSKNPYRYFTKEELRSLFVLENPYSSQTQQQLQEMHANQRITDEELDDHLAFLMSQNIFGLSDHDLMFKCTEEDEAPDPGYIGQIRMQVEKAKEMVRKDAELVEKINKEGGNLQYREYTQENAKKRLGGGGGENPYLMPDVLAAMGVDLSDYCNYDDKENIQWIRPNHKPNERKRPTPSAPPLSLHNEQNIPIEEILIEDTPDVTPSSSFCTKNDGEAVLIEDSEAEDEITSKKYVDQSALASDISNVVIEESMEEPAEQEPTIEEPSANPELDMSLLNLSTKAVSEDWFKDIPVEQHKTDRHHKRRSVAAFDLYSTFKPMKEDSLRRRSMNFGEVQNSGKMNVTEWQPYANVSALLVVTSPSSPKHDDDAVEMIDLSQKRIKKEKKDRLSVSRRSSSSSSELRRGLKNFHQPSITNFMKPQPMGEHVNGGMEKVQPRRRSVATPVAARRRSQPLTVLNSDDDDDDADFKPNSSRLKKVPRPVMSDDGETEIEEVSLVSSDEESKSLNSSSSGPANESYSGDDQSALSITDTPSSHSFGGTGDNSEQKSVRLSTGAKDQIKLGKGNSRSGASKVEKLTPGLSSNSDRSYSSRYTSASLSPPTSSTQENVSRVLHLSSSDEDDSFRSAHVDHSSYDIDVDSPVIVVSRRKNTRMIVDSDNSD